MAEEDRTPAVDSQSQMADLRVGLKEDKSYLAVPRNEEPNDPFIDDVFGVELNESCWCPAIRCCPFNVSLTMSTIIAAILGAIIGLIVQASIPECTMSPSMSPTMEPTLMPTMTGYTGIQTTESMMPKTTMMEECPGVSDDLLELLGFPGALWIRALKLLVLPLISLMMLVLPSRVEKVGRIGETALPFFFLTSTCAAIQGTCWAWIIRPGKYSSSPKSEFEDYYDDIGDKVDDAGTVTVLDSILGIFYNAVPSNIVMAMGDLSVLGIICFFLMFGILLRQVRRHDRIIVVRFANAFLKCTMIAVSWVVWLTPIGMLSMVMVKIIGTEDFFGLLKALGMYLVTAMIGHTIHVTVVLALIFFFVVRQNPWSYLVRISDAPLVAFATSSSAATLSVSTNVAERAGVAKDCYNFILPLGAAINMDGTAQGFPIMIGFIAQLYGYEVNFGQVIAIMILSIIISIGTAPIPNAGMVYLIMLLQIAGMEEITEEAIATLFILDWFIDRVETAVNVTSDQFITKMVDEIEVRREKKDDDIESSNDSNGDIEEEKGTKEVINGNGHTTKEEYGNGDLLKEEHVK